MSNQFILWSSVILPWLSILFLKKEDIKRYMPAALLGSLIVVTIADMGITLKWWVIKENVFPLNEIEPFVYGIYPISIIWIFKYTYQKLWVYFATNFIIDFIASFFIYSWFVSRGVVEINLSDSQMLLIHILTASGIYAYLRWQDHILTTSEQAGLLAKLQPASAKPLPGEQRDDPDNQ